MSNRIQRESGFRVTLQGRPKSLGRELDRGNPKDIFEGSFLVQIEEHGEVLEEIEPRDIKCKLFLNPVGNKVVLLTTKKEIADNEEGTTLLFNERGNPEEAFFVLGNKFFTPGDENRTELKGKITRSKIPGYGIAYGINPLYFRMGDDWITIGDTLRTPSKVREFDIEPLLPVMITEMDLLLKAKDLFLDEII